MPRFNPRRRARVSAAQLCSSIEADQLIFLSTLAAMEDRSVSSLVREAIGALEALVSITEGKGQAERTAALYDLLDGAVS